MSAQVKKSVFGRYCVKYDCANCNERLTSPLTDAGKTDSCPTCGSGFVVPGADELKGITEANQRSAQRKAESAAYTQELKNQKKRQTAEARVRVAQQAQEEEERRSAEVRAARERIREQDSKPNQRCPKCGNEILQGSPHCANCNAAIPTQNEARKTWSLSRILAGAALGAILLFTYFWVRNYDLREKLKACETYGVVNATVKYEGIVTTDTVVFDLLDGGSGSARRIDTIHLLLQFASRIDLHSIDRVVLARNGADVFYISSEDLRRLADSYAGGGRVWSFDNLPERVRTMDGKRRFGEWTGGWLGVLNKQMEDLNEFMKEWLDEGR